MTQLVDYDPFAGPALERTHGATEAQHEIWAATRLGADASCAFNESISLHLHGPLDVPALRRAALQLVQHHEALRATFSPADGQVCIAASVTIDVPVDDLSPSPAAERDARHRAALDAEVETSFDLEHGPLMRLRVLRLAADVHVLIFAAHHIVCDGWSMAVLLRDLGRLYSGAQPAVAQAFSVYARHVAGVALTQAQHEAEGYWQRQFAGEVPVLELPLDRPRPPVKTFHAARHDHVLDAELVTALKRVGARQGASFFVTLLAAYVAFLQRLTGQRDLVVGIPTAGQSSAALPNVVGHCVNMLPLRCRVDPAAPFTACLGEVRRQVLDGYDHQQVTFGRLLQLLRVPRDPSRLPLVGTVFNLDQQIDGKDLGFRGLEVEFRSNPRHFENAELSVNAAEAAGRVVLECQYNSDLFDQATARDRMVSFEALLRGIVADPEAPVARLPMLSRTQQQRILVEWNASERCYPRDGTLVQLLEQQAQRTPDGVAVVAGAEALTYQALHARANQLAWHLQRLGAGPGVLVGLCVERGVEMPVGLLGVLKSGAAYVPLDPAYPHDRLRMMLEDAQVAVVVTQESLCERLPAGNWQTVSLDRVPFEALPTDAPACQAGPADVAYVIYTSGSTGTPKGVCVAHGNIAHLLQSLTDYPGIDDSDALVALASAAFDMSIPELLAPLTVGARVVVASREAASDGPQLVRLLAESGATLVQGTPATWRLLLAAGWPGSPTLTAWSGGEALSADLVRALLARVDRLFNLYGPTETTCFCSAGELTDPVRVHIGRPVAGMQVYLLDDHGEAVPAGVPGELTIGGTGVALGYLRRPELTAERFVANPYHDPFADHLNPCLYRSGDLARWRHDGTLEYLGRNDAQIKLRGFRIEPGEIEAALTSHPAVHAAAVVARSDRPDDVRLMAYVVYKPGQSATVTELRRALKQRLPDYMVPQQVVELEALPLTANGKLDRARLPVPGVVTPPANTQSTPATPSEQYLIRLWQEALPVTTVCPGDNFFQLGGHSLLAFQMLARIEQETGVRLPPRSLILNTLAQVAAQVPVDRLPGAAPTAPLGLMGKLRGWFGS